MASARPSGQANVFPEPAKRGSAPGDERPDAHQQEERQAEDAKEEVVVRAAHHDRCPSHGLREDRPGDPPEDGQAQSHEEQVVVEEHGLAGNE